MCGLAAPSLDKRRSPLRGLVTTIRPAIHSTRRTPPALTATGKPVKAVSLPGAPHMVADAREPPQTATIRGRGIRVLPDTVGQLNTAVATPVGRLAHPLVSRAGRPVLMTSWGRSQKATRTLCAARTMRIPRTRCVSSQRRSTTNGGCSCIVSCCGRRLPPLGC